MSYDVGEDMEMLENELCFIYVTVPSFVSPTSHALHLRHLASCPWVHIYTAMALGGRSRLTSPMLGHLSPQDQFEHEGVKKISTLRHPESNLGGPAGISFKVICDRYQIIFSIFISVYLNLVKNTIP